MPAMAPIVINDGATTPVSHTFAPVGSAAGSKYVNFVERVNGKIDFGNEVRIAVDQAQARGQASKVRTTMILPTTVEVNGITTLDFQNRYDGTFTLASRGTESARKNLRVLVSNLYASAFVASVVDKVEAIW